MTKIMQHMVIPFPSNGTAVPVNLGDINTLSSLEQGARTRPNARLLIAYIVEH